MYFLVRTLWGLSPLIVYAWKLDKHFKPLTGHELEEYLYEDHANINFFVVYRQHLLSRGIEVPTFLDEYLLVQRERKTEGEK